MWSVYVDNELLYATGLNANSSHIVINPNLAEELNSAGSFQCGVPVNNELYKKIKLRTSTVEAKKDGKIKWRGRPLSADIGYNKTMQLVCEGALAFLNDTVYPPDTCKVRLSILVDKVLSNHNERCDANRQIHLGSFTMDDPEIEYNGSYTQTIEVIKNLLETYGGYLIPHYAEGGNYFDWVKSIQLDTHQEINIENLTDFSKSISADDIVTCVIPVGKDGLTIGGEYIENEAASALFGKVWQCVEFSDIEDADELYNAGANYLNENIWASMQLDLTAAEVGEGYEIGKMYLARIPTFGLSHNIALTSYNTSLADSSATKYGFSASTIWTQLNNGKDISDAIDTAQRLRIASEGSLTSRTAKMEAVLQKAAYYSGDIMFSDGTKITCVNGMITGGKSQEGDF